MADLKIVGVGAGIAVGLAFIAWLFVTLGQSATTFGIQTGLSSFEQLGQSFTGYGNAIIIILVICLVAVIGAIIASLLRSSDSQF